MAELKKLFIALAVFTFGWWSSKFFFGSNTPPPGVLAARAPIQAPVLSAAAWDFGPYKVTPLANYDIEARVLSTRTYRDDWSDLCNLDLALGWQRMSDSAVLEHIKIWQEGRFFWWQTGAVPPLPQAELVLSAANTHVIPSTPRIADELAALRVGQVVRLRGKLIEAVKPGGPVLRSSMRRDDTGKGACEIFWVEFFEVK